MIIDACIKKCNNIASKQSAKSSLLAIHNVDESKSKFMALLTNLFLAVLAATAQQRPTTSSHGQPHQNHNSQPSYLKNLDPTRFVHAGPTITGTSSHLWHYCTHHNNNNGLHASHPASDTKSFLKGIEGSIRT